MKHPLKLTGKGWVFNLQDILPKFQIVIGTNNNNNNEFSSDEGDGINIFRFLRFLRFGFVAFLIEYLINGIHGCGLLPVIRGIRRNGQRCFILR